MKNFLLWELIKNLSILEFLKDPIKFASVIYDKGSLKDANDTQKEMLAKLDDFEEYSPRKPETVEEKI